MTRSSLARAERWVTPLVGLAVVAVAVWIVARNFSPPKAIGADPSPDGSSTNGAANDDGGGLLFAYGDAGAAGVDDASPLLVSDLIDREARGDGGATGTAMPDGTPVPPLPVNAPRQVHFGAVLVSYAGAQVAIGARPLTRSRTDARALAERLLPAAQQDFHAAVQQGDPGSTDDLGQVKAGILEPAPEYVLFTLPVGGIGGPVDTPRGYWIVKRLE